MRMRLLGFLTLVACTGPVRAPAPSRPTADTHEGTVLGQVDRDGVASFLGVPYAAPPVGGDRWREAQPPRPHPPLEATTFRLPCSQIPLPAGGDSFGSGKKIQSSEDCLYLNVWVPPRTGEKLPVMPGLHGGQSLRGGASQYTGAQLARLGRVVVVPMDYRLGPLGLLAHPALTAESPRHTSGNELLFDHLQALMWLRANIAAFG